MFKALSVNHLRKTLSSGFEIMNYTSETNSINFTAESFFVFGTNITIKTENGKEYNNTIGATSPNSVSYLVSTDKPQLAYFYFFSIDTYDDRKRYFILSDEFEEYASRLVKIYGAANETNFTRITMLNPNGADVKLKSPNNTKAYFSSRSDYEFDYYSEETNEYSLKNVTDLTIWNNRNNSIDFLYDGGHKYVTKITATGKSKNITLPNKIFEIRNETRIYLQSDDSDKITDFSRTIALTPGIMALVLISGVILILVALFLIYWFCLRSKFNVLPYINTKRVLISIIVALSIINFVGSIVIAVQLRKYFEPIAMYVDGLPKFVVNVERANIGVPVIFIVLGAVSWVIAEFIPGKIRYVSVGVLLSVILMEAITNSVFAHVSSFSNIALALSRVPRIAFENEDLKDSEKMIINEWSEMIKEETQKYDTVVAIQTLSDKAGAFMVIAYIILLLSAFYWFNSLIIESPKPKHDDPKNEELINSSLPLN